MQAFLFLQTRELCADGPGLNPITNETVVTERRRIRVDLDLPIKTDYAELIRKLLRT